MNTSMVPRHNDEEQPRVETRPLPVGAVDGEDTLRRHTMGTDNQLNAVFVEQVGPQTAQRFVDALIRVGARYRHRERAEIAAALAREFADIGVEVGPTEVDSFADEISRSEAVTAHV